MNRQALTVEYINSRVKSDPLGFIRECEREYDNSIWSVADKICESSGHTIVMLAGPSSSGKTTTAHMLEQRLQKKGVRSVTVSLDDFYLDQTQTPAGADGSPDFEAVEALDIPLITHCLSALDGEGKCVLPVFSFKKKRREPAGRTVTLGDNDIVIVEGLHALNPVITDTLPKEDLLKLYISASSRVYDGEDILLSKREVRFVRRLIRDYKHRDSSVEYTFKLWKSVRKGEDRYLFPFSNLADVKINTMHPYEPCAMRGSAIELLSRVPEKSDCSQRAGELCEKLSRFAALGEAGVPESSLLMEFLG